MLPAGLSLEATLDLLDPGNGDDGGLRSRVKDAIGIAFSSLVPPLDEYRAFVRGLGRRTEAIVPVFTLNYDCLMECAADANAMPLVDGFSGVFQGTFQPAHFLQAVGQMQMRRHRRVFVARQGLTALHKLHGSLGWFSNAGGHIVRICPDAPVPAGHNRLMVPPQHRKAADTGVTPYATLWSEFRAFLANDASRALNRLVCVGYGFADGHVNAIIDAALARNNFTLLILARGLSDDAFRKYAGNRNIIVVTESRSALYGENGAGLPDEWSFEWLSREV
jgi:hypothetical protein